MRSFNLFCGFVALMSGAVVETSRADEHGLSPEFDAAVRSVVELVQNATDEGASGILRIKVGDTVLIETGFGSASCTTNERVTPEHLFMIGSITKELTRVLGFVLEEKGALSLDDTVADVLPGFDGPIGHVTLRQLMDHVGGLPDIVDAKGRAIPYTLDYDYEPVSRDELFAKAALADLQSEPGEQEQYSNLGYQLLAAIYEVKTGTSYPELLRRYVYTPANMTATDYWFDDAESRSFADGCRANDERWGNPIDDGMWAASGPSWNLKGAGGHLSTAESLGRFLEGIGAGVYFDDPAQAEKYKASRLAFSERRQQRVMATAGSNGIFNAVGVWADGDRFSLVLITNRAEHPAEGGLVQDIMKAFPPELFQTRDDP